MSYENLYIYGSVSVALIFVLGFYFTNRRGSRRKSSTASATTIDASKDEGSHNLKKDKTQTTPNATSPATSSSNAVVNGLRKRTGQAPPTDDHTTNNNNINGNSKNQNQNNCSIPTITVNEENKEKQDVLILQNFVKSPLTPHKRLSIHNTSSSNNNNNSNIATTDNDNKSQRENRVCIGAEKTASTCSQLDAKPPSSDFDADKDSSKSVQLQEPKSLKQKQLGTRKEKGERSVERVDTFDDINDDDATQARDGEKVKRVNQPSSSLELNVIEENFVVNDSSEETMRNCFDENYNIEARKQSIGEDRPVTITNGDFLPQMKNITTSVEQEFEISSRGDGTLTINVDTNDLEIKAYTKDALISSKKHLEIELSVMQQDALKNRKGSEVPQSLTNPPKLSKFKLFVFQQYADKISDSILSRTSNTLERFRDTQFDYADDLTMSILYAAQKEMTRKVQERISTNSKKEGNRTLDLLADDLVKGIIDKLMDSQLSPLNGIGLLKDNIEQKNTKNNKELVSPNDKGVSQQSNLPKEGDSLGMTETDGGVSTDYGRPLSGYAKNLADFLAEDDDEFEDFSDDDDDSNYKEEICENENNNNNSYYKAGISRNVDSLEHLEDESEDDLDESEEETSDDEELYENEANEIQSNKKLKNIGNDDETNTNKKSVANQVEFIEIEQEVTTAQKYTNSKISEEQSASSIEIGPKIENSTGVSITNKADNRNTSNSNEGQDSERLISSSGSNNRTSEEIEKSPNDFTTPHNKDASEKNETINSSIKPQGEEQATSVIINGVATKSSRSNKDGQFAAPAKRRQNKNRRTRGERPKSLYEQDLQELMPDIHKYAEGDEEGVTGDIGAEEDTEEDTKEV